MDEISLPALFGALVFLLVLSAFFSGSETGLIALNRYRLRHLAKSGHLGAQRASRLLERPDRLIGLILLGNNFVNILASSLATIIALRLMGEAGIAVAAGLLTLVVLVFSEVAPKTIAALHPERFAFPAAVVLEPLLKLLYPLVWLVNGAANLVLRPFGISTRGGDDQALRPEELRTLVVESGRLIPKRHRSMLLSILDLEEVTVEDIMVPRNEVVGIDLEDSMEQIREQLAHCQYTKVPVYRGRVDQVVGFLHLRELINQLSRDASLNHEDIEALIREPYFIPENTPLNTQLVNFQKLRRHIGLVVDEYGDLMGLVTLQDILEEIVGEFTTDPSDVGDDIRHQSDGAYLIDAGTSVRAINRALGWHLPVDGPRTLNGLIIERLENIPESEVRLTIGDYVVEILETAGHTVKTARVKSGTKQPAGANQPGKSS